MERKLRQMVIEWRKEEDKNKVVKQMEACCLRKMKTNQRIKCKRKLDLKYDEIGGEIKPGDKVKMKRNHQVGQVIELRGKRAVVKIGLLPMQVEIKDLVVVKEKVNEE